MSNIESTRSHFFPKSKSARANKNNKLNKNYLQRNDHVRKAELDQISERDAKVSIPEAVKDFGRIKKVADLTPNVDQSDKIMSLREKIKEGRYEIDYDALADKILSQEF